MEFYDKYNKYADEKLIKEKAEERANFRLKSIEERLTKQEINKNETKN